MYSEHELSRHPIINVIFVLYDTAEIGVKSNTIEVRLTMA